MRRNFHLILISMVYLIILFLLLPSHVIITQFANAQLQLNNSSNNAKFKSYYNPLLSIKILYPSFWHVLETPGHNLVSFVSPLKTLGVIIQNNPELNMSIDEATLNMISNIKNSLPNVTIQNSSLLNSADGTVIQNLLFTYGSGSNTFKVSQFLKIFEERIYIFTYFADGSLFDRFLPSVMNMYDSFQIPYFGKFSSAKIFSNISPNIKIDSVKITDKDNIYKNISNISIQNKQISNVDNISIYDNKSLGIKIQYPVSFHKIEKDRGILLTTSSKSIGITLVNIPLYNISSDNFNTDHILTLNKTLTNFNIVNSSISDILGYPTQMILFTYHNGTQIYKGLQLWKVNIQNAYIFTYFAPFRIFDDSLPMVIKMIDSLKFS